MIIIEKCDFTEKEAKFFHQWAGLDAELGVVVW